MGYITSLVLIYLIIGTLYLLTAFIQSPSLNILENNLFLLSNVCTYF